MKAGRGDCCTIFPIKMAPCSCFQSWEGNFPSRASSNFWRCLFCWVQSFVWLFEGYFTGCDCHDLVGSLNQEEIGSFASRRDQDEKRDQDENHSYWLGVNLLCRMFSKDWGFLSTKVSCYRSDIGRRLPGQLNILTPTFAWALLALCEQAGNISEIPTKRKGK